MLFYTFPWSNHATRVEIILRELDISYEAKVVDLMGENRTPAFLALNPNAKVPVIDDGGFVLWESHAIMRYLCDTYKGGDWYPQEAKARANIEKWLDWGHTRLNADAITINFNNVVLREKGDRKRVQEAEESVKELLALLNVALEGRNYLGDNISIADISLFTSIVYLQHNSVPIGQYEQISKWYDRINKRESVIEARKGMDEMKAVALS